MTRRDTTQTIWRTVVVAGAMLGAPACHKAKPAPTTPPPASNTAAPDPTTQTRDTPQSDPVTTPAPPTQAADPCAGAEPEPPAQAVRPRGGGDRPTGRGFVLA